MSSLFSSIYLIATPTGTTILLFVLILLLFISFLLSGAEIAFFSMSIKDLNVLKTRPQVGYKRIVTLLEKPKKLWATLFVGNIFANVGIILIANSLLPEKLEGLDVPVAIAIILKILIIAIVIILFCEILPKIWATHHKIWFASTASLVVEVANSLLSPISKRFVNISDGVENIFKSNSASFDDEELAYEIDLLPDHETSKKEKQLLKGIRKFGTTTVKQTMITRLDVIGIENDTSFNEVMAKFRTIPYSRLPVYKNNLDEIVGMLHTKDLLSHLHKNDFDWHTLLRPVFYVHEQKLIEDLLQDFRNKRIHIAVVVDEFGGTSGIITLEDIMEEIIGDIQDEFDNEKSINQKIDDYNYILEGKTMINDLCALLNLPPHAFDELRGESDSLAGLVLEIAGKFPEINETIATPGFEFRVLDINKNRIERVKLTVIPAEEN